MAPVLKRKILIYFNRFEKISYILLGKIVSMKAMLIERLGEILSGQKPLILADIEKPVPGSNQILIRVSVCGVCHTELDIIEGRTEPEKLPVVPGHQVVGTVAGKGSGVTRFKTGDRAGVAWIYSSCGRCGFCRHGKENLCEYFKATGRDVNGGYAEFITVDERFAYLIPDTLNDSEIAPVLCAGAIGYRSLKLCNISDGDTLGLTGFGASAHIVIKLVRVLYPETDVYVFARSPEQRRFATELGAKWSGDTDSYSPVKLDAIIDTTPVWKPVVESMKNLQRGGRLVINAIRKENFDKEYLLNLNYGEHLWMEKEIKSVANVTRNDVEEIIKYVDTYRIVPEVTEYRLEDANQALIDIKSGNSRGAKVLKVS